MMSVIVGSKGSKVYMSKLLNFVFIIFCFVSVMLFGTITQMQHMCGVASMIVSALSSEGFALR